MSDTIFALATSPGRAAVAVVRVSGPKTETVLQAMLGALPAPREASLRNLRRPTDGALLDRALVLWFPGPASYTGEDLAEFQLHGGQAVVDGVEACLAGYGLRPAEPGEFTRRAFQNGKLDLSQAEAVADLIDAQTDAQRRQALGQLDGALARRHEAWREALVNTLALLEANVDFPDEELPEDLAARARPGMFALARELEAALSDAQRGAQVRDGFRLALVGAPNAGKSSLFNWLAGREAAIVTPTPGTTRDVIEVPISVSGFRVILADTAGVRESRDEIEVEGVKRAKAWAEQADMRIWVIDGSTSGGAWRETAGLARPGDVCVLNKCDLPSGLDGRAARKVNPDACAISVSTEEGLKELVALLRQKIIAAMSGAEFPAATRERHQRHLKEAAAHVARALEVLGSGSELAAEDLRLAARALERISGRIDPEEILDRVFGQFCIGK